MSQAAGASRPRAGAASFDEVDDLDDAALVARARQDPEAFAALFRRHADTVHSFIWRRTRDDALADDLTAVVFERCWSALDDLRPRRDSLRPWLVTIASNEIASYFRSEGRRRKREELVVRRDEPTRDAGTSSGLDAADDELLAALSTLGRRHQEVLSLRFFADLPTEEAARVLGVSRRHFAVLQHRALAALRRRLAAMTEDSGGERHG